MDPVEGTVTVSSGTLNLRDYPSSTGTVIANLPNGAKVTIYGEWNGWYVVDYNGQTGYAAAPTSTREERAVPGQRPGAAGAACKHPAKRDLTPGGALPARHKSNPGPPKGQTLWGVERVVRGGLQRPDRLCGGGLHRHVRNEPSRPAAGRRGSGVYYTYIYWILRRAGSACPAQIKSWAPKGPGPLGRGTGGTWWITTARQAMRRRPTSTREERAVPALADLVKNSKSPRRNLGNYYRFALTEEGGTIKL